jgi:hypothetical protein
MHGNEMHAEVRPAVFQVQERTVRGLTRSAAARKPVAGAGAN